MQNGLLQMHKMQKCNSPLVFFNVAKPLITLNLPIGQL